MDNTCQSRCYQFCPKRLRLWRNPVNLGLLLIRGHVSDNCQGYMFLLYKCFKEIINSWNYDFLIFLPFTIWYIVSTFFWKTFSDLPQSTRWYNTTIVLSQTAIYPPYELLVAGITKRPKIRLHETSIHYSNYGTPKFLDSGRNSWTLDFGRWTLHSGHWTLDARRDT